MAKGWPGRDGGRNPFFPRRVVWRHKGAIPGGPTGSTWRARVLITGLITVVVSKTYKALHRVGEVLAGL